MRIFTWLLCVIFFILAGSCDTKSNVEFPGNNFFMKLYGGDGDQSGVDFIALDDGNYLLLGNSESGSAKRIFLVLTDPFGNQIWEKKLGGFSETANDIEPLSNGNFIILSTFQQSVDNTDIKLIRIRPDGSKIDSVMYGFSENDNAQSVTVLSDGGFIVTGSTLHDEGDFNPEDPDAFSNIFHFRCDANLFFDNSNWREYYGNTGVYDAGTKVFENANRFYVFGYSNKLHIGNDLGKMNLQYYEIDAGAVTGSDEAFVGDFDQETRSAFVTQVPPELGGGFFILGTKTSNTGVITMHVAKLRSDVSFKPTDILLDEAIDPDGRTLTAVSAAPAVVAGEGYFLLGNELRTDGFTNIWLAKINQGAVKQWSVSLGSEGEDDRAATVKELSDGKIIVLGTVGLGDHQRKMALFKLNSAGRLQD